WRSSRYFRASSGFQLLRSPPARAIEQATRTTVRTKTIRRSLSANFITIPNYFCVAPVFIGRPPHLIPLPQGGRGDSPRGRTPPSLAPIGGEGISRALSLLLVAIVRLGSEFSAEQPIYLL